MRSGALLGLAAMALLVARPLAGQEGSGFPHARHEGLFPLCTGCHAGTVADGGDLYPDAEACAPCHDGVRRPSVLLATRPSPPDNLTFSHPRHARVANPQGYGCGTCHGTPGVEEGMAVQAATAERCLSCHAHEASSHLAEGRDCRACHLPLTDATGLTAVAIDAFPAPPSHGTASFPTLHGSGEATRCGICHARESCTRCHMNGDAVAAIRSLRPDPRVAALESGRPPEYAAPESHGKGDWAWAHGPSASEAPGGCSNCHAASSCLSCHRPGTVAAVDSLPRPAAGDPRGVAVRPGLVHPPDYALHHAAAAAGPSCESCHEEDFCASCHRSADRPAFHVPGFVQLHGPEAYAAATDCSSCHSVEVFCRACHAELGMVDAPSGATFHTSRPFWLLGHGMAARRGLEGCVSCHSQADCTRCHSAYLGWGVNPHGPAFDGAALRDADPFACSPCHLGGVPR